METLQLISTLGFLIVYYRFGIYTASLFLAVTSLVQFLLCTLVKKESVGINQTSHLLLMVFGFMTWYFSNARFIQWKITIVNVLFAVALYGYRHFNDEAFFTGTFRAANLNIPNHAGIKADNMLLVFLMSIGIINYIVFTNYSEETWVLFKTSIIFINIAYLIGITAYLTRFVDNARRNDSRTLSK